MVIRGSAALQDTLTALGLRAYVCAGLCVELVAFRCASYVLV